MNKNKKIYLIVCILFILLGFIITVGIKHNQNQLEKAEIQNSNERSSSSILYSSVGSSSSTSISSNVSKIKQELPNSHQSDWNLILVNKWNKKAELSPKLTVVDGKEVDYRIASATEQFLTAAQKISASEHLVSAYRSVTYQTQLYNYYIEQEKSGSGTVNKSGKSISEKEAVVNVNTYSMPPGMSEHNTGLAIDMSTVDSLNDSDPEVVAKVMELAPRYGFILHFQKGMSNSTGIEYEDWHYRYVGVENAKYMTKNNLSLEQFVALLPR